MLNNVLTETLTRADICPRVLQVLYHYRRSLDGLDQTELCLPCTEARQSQIQRFVQDDEQIRFVIPAFPAKSPNRRKVLGELPDLGERIALGALQSFCHYVSHFYAPGARITICSDGHVFGDVVGVTDGSVTAYRECLADIIATEELTALDLFGLDDAFANKDYPGLRAVLDRDYAVPIDDLKERVRTDRATGALFNGIHRFMFEDAIGLRGHEESRTKLRNDSKESAYETILRSNAWSRVVAERFPDAIRMSIHPQPPHSEKFGLHLMRTGDRWLTPWHGVVLDNGVSLSLVKRWEAEKLEATIVLRDGRPSHFVAPHLGIHS